MWRRASWGRSYVWQMWVTARLYTIGEEEIRQITRDHSLVEELVERGEMERGSAAYEERKNIITRAIGARRGVSADFFEVRSGGR